MSTPSHPDSPDAKPEQIPDVSKLSEAFGAVLARDSAARATLTAGTPETDSATIWLSETGISNDDKSPFVRREVARQLEKDRNALRGQVEDYKRAYNECWAGSPAVKAELESLRAQLAAAPADGEEM